ncbi:MAG: ELM1/GtrOC1 family putative glycosyltransferase [Candidatus Omnitrophota bacterium]
MTDFLGFIAVKFLSAVFRCLPLRLSLWLGRRAGDIVYFINLKRRSIAYANLKAAFPLKDPGELRRINRAHFEHLGMSMVELLKLPGLGRGYFEKYMEFRDTERIGEALANKKGVMFLTGHFGNWEFSSIAASKRGYKMSVFAREQKYERLNALLNRYRESTGSKVIAKGFSARDIIKTLKNNGMVGILFDQDAGFGGVLVDFLGRPASMAQGPVVFSLRTGARILPSFIWRVDKARHVAQVGEELVLIDTGNEPEDLRKNLQRISDMLAGYINMFPEQWLWAHKRWKTTPQRSVLVLSDGKAGHFNQSMAVAEMTEGAMAARFRARGIELKPIVKIQTAEIRFKNIFTKAFLNAASLFASRRCQGCLRCLKFCLTRESFEGIRDKYADVVVSCGASAAATNIFLKYENNAKNAVIMDPGLGRKKRFDLVILPRHDAPSKSRRNVLVIEAAPNRMDTRTQGHKDTGRKGIGVLIGGDAKNFKLDEKDVEAAVNGALKAAGETGRDIFVSTSRRTSSAIDGLLKEKLSADNRCGLLVIASENNRKGAVQEIFDNSDILIVSPESISMISEAVSSGRHVIVFEARRTARNVKYEENVRNLEAKGYLKTSAADKIYEAVKDIMENKPDIKRLSDSDDILERLQRIIGV